MTEAWKQYEGQFAGGTFQLRKFLGESYGSAVFLTERNGQQPDRAAIKLVIADPANAEQQLSRWRAAAKLSHPNLLQLYEMGRSRLAEVEIVYLVMEFADEDVSQILPHRALSPAEARDMLGPVLEGLAHLHNKGFIHGRVKPANIGAVDNQIKLSVDGIRRMGDASGGHAAPSPYDPPEAATEKAAPAADVWSLGMTLVEVLTQRLPTWERMGQKDPQIRETVPPPLLDIARNCLRRDPRSRLTLEGIAARLQPGAPIPRHGIPAVPVARDQSLAAKTERRSSKSNYLAVAIAVAAALILGITRFTRHDAKAQPESASASRPAAVQPKPEPVRETVETKRAAAKQPNFGPAENVPGPAPSAATRPEAAEKPAAAITPGEVLHRVVPEVPQQASNTISGTVKVVVRVSVDSSGKVAQTSLDAAGPSKYFANLALQAARQWTFSPASSAGQRVSSEWMLRFEFTRNGAQAIPSRLVPH